MEPADRESLGKVLSRWRRAPQGISPSRRRFKDLPRVLADEGAAEQAIENLLANATKHSGEAKTIEVSASRENGHIVERHRPRHWHLRARAGRIFRKFYRVQRELGGGPHSGLGWPSSTTRCAATAATCASRASLRRQHVLAALPHPQ
jgi:signal transduction histidine kinase